MLSLGPLTRGDEAWDGGSSAVGMAALRKLRTVARSQMPVKGAGSAGIHPGSSSTGGTLRYNQGHGLGMGG